MTVCHYSWSFMKRCSHSFLAIQLLIFLPKILSSCQPVPKKKGVQNSRTQTYHRGIVNRHTNKNRAPRTEKTRRGP